MARLPTPGQDSGTWGDILNEFLSVEHNPDGTLRADGSLGAKADDNTVVHDAGAEVIGGTKTFSSSPVVPAPTLGSHATTKTYVDSTVSAGTPDASSTTKGIVRLAGDLSGTATAPTVPGLASKQATSVELTTIAGLTPADDDILQRKDGAWTNRPPAQLKLDLNLTKGDVGLANVDNTSDMNKPISIATQNSLNSKGNDTEVVHLTGNETVGGIKTFTSSPVVPAPVADGQATTKAYADDISNMPSLAVGYWRSSTGGTSSVNTTLNLNQAYCVPIMCPGGITIDSIAVRPTGVAGGILRLGLYADNGHGAPGALLVDAGTVDASTSGSKQLAVSVVVPYTRCLWAAIASQGSGSVSVIGSNLSPTLGVPPDSLSATTALLGVGYYYTDATVSGALPATWTGAITGTSATPPRLAVHRGA